MRSLSSAFAAVLLLSLPLQALAQGTVSQRLKNFQTYSGLAGEDDFDTTETPVIGVISQTLEKEMLNDDRFKGYKSYIMKSYVDWLQSAGVRVVPMVMDEPLEVTMDKLSRVNGVLFPGGDGSYHDYGRVVFDQVVKINDNGTYLPIWGTCAGQHELLSYVSDAGWDVLDVYDMDSASLTLDFVYEDPTASPMFAGLGPSARLFEEYNVTYNSHHWSLNPSKFETDKGLGQWFKPTSLSYMPDGRSFVASMETTGEMSKYPFYGTQFHPEKAARIFSEEQAVNHSWFSIRLNNHFADFFVQQCRKSPQKYGNYSVTQKDIIQNSDLIITDEWFDSVYVFHSNTPDGALRTLASLGIASLVFLIAFLI